MAFSFYGGRQGESFKIVRNFISLEDIKNKFSQGASYRDVNYGEYVLINSNDVRSAENGQVYRRGLEGPEYVGRISGPPGYSPHIMGDEAGFQENYQSTDNYTKNLIQDVYVLTEDNNSLIPGGVKEEIIPEGADENKPDYKKYVWNTDAFRDSIRLSTKSEILENAENFIVTRPFSKVYENPIVDNYKKDEEFPIHKYCWNEDFKNAYNGKIKKVYKVAKPFKVEENDEQEVSVGTFLEIDNKNIRQLNFLHNGYLKPVWQAIADIIIQLQDTNVDYNIGDSYPVREEDKDDVTERLEQGYIAPIDKTAVKLGFEFPYPVFNFDAKSVTPYIDAYMYEDNNESITKGHLFAHDYMIRVPKGVKGDTVVGIYEGTVCLEGIEFNKKNVYGEETDDKIKLHSVEGIQLEPLTIRIVTEEGEIVDTTIDNPDEYFLKNQYYDGQKFLYYVVENYDEGNRNECYENGNEVTDDNKINVSKKIRTTYHYLSVAPTNVKLINDDDYYSNAKDEYGNLIGNPLIKARIQAGSYGLVLFTPPEYFSLGGKTSN